MTTLHELEARPWEGRKRNYDFIKEGVVAVLLIGFLAVALSIFFGSPDDQQITFKKWAIAAPADFYSTTIMELDGSSGTGGYGPPYNHASSGVNLGPIFPAKLFGVSHPIDTVNDFVISPLATQNNSPEVKQALATWNSAPQATQTSWASTYDAALTKSNGVAAKVSAANYGPVPVLAQALLEMAQSGALDGALLSQGNYFQMNNTKQTLFLGDGNYLQAQSAAANLQGNTWGMMNETGRYPGQAWLWLYSFWYQIPPFNNGDNHPFGANADAYVMAIMGLFSVTLICIPFIPGLRSVPKLVPIHRLIWRQYYREENL